MTSAELTIKMNPKKTTLARMKRLLDKLTEVGGGCYDYGGEEAIVYTVNGDIICNEIEDEDVAGMIEAFDRRGYWPAIMVYDADYPTPSEGECRAKLNDLDYDFQDLWNWIKSVVYEEGSE